MVFNKTEEQEKKYLQEIINTLNDVINNTSVSVKEHVDTLQRVQRVFMVKIKILIHMKFVL